MSVINGDCIVELQKIEELSVDMIYLDPPFFTQKKHKQKTRDNSKEYQFEDSWDSIDEYRLFLKDRLLQCKRVLKNEGTIFVHCDKTASHHIRLVLDAVFGNNNFKNEIIWTYKRWTSSKSSLQSQHQTIYFYGKTSATKFKTLFTEYSPTTNIDQILQNRVRDENGKTKYKTDENGVVELASDKRGVPLGDVWEIPYLNPKAKERVGYPTQKPILLLEKIIEISTDEGDLVLDPFCGSGTTLVAAKLMNRKFIGIDISKEACELSETRLANPVRTESNLLKKGKNAYLSKSDFEYKVLNLLGATPVQRNAGIDGFIKVSEQEQVIPVKIQKHTETIQEAAFKLSNATFKKGLTKKILIKTSEKEMKEPISPPKDENLIVLETLNLSLQKALQSSESNSGLALFPHTSNGRK